VTTPALTKERAPAVVQAAVAERDAIQANLLELDGSFGKRMLEGAVLTRQTKRRWDAAAASLAAPRQIYSAYSAVVDRAAEALARGTSDEARQIQLVDLANAVRPRTLT
jgi:hypothetical protein